MPLMRRWLISNLPSGAVKLFAGPYIAGAEIGSAMDVAAAPPSRLTS